MKQILFYDISETPRSLHAGILLDNGDCICGCCGGLFEKDEYGEAWEIEKEYPEWMDIQIAICGDDEDLIRMEKENGEIQGSHPSE